MSAFWIPPGSLAYYANVSTSANTLTSWWLKRDWHSGQDIWSHILFSWSTLIDWRRRKRQQEGGWLQSVVILPLGKLVGGRSSRQTTHCLSSGGVGASEIWTAAETRLKNVEGDGSWGNGFLDIRSAGMGTSSSWTAAETNSDQADCELEP